MHRIKPLGDSITVGIDGIHTLDGLAGYRKPLWDGLAAAGHQVAFVGSQETGLGVTGDWDRHHEGHGGYRLDQLDTEIPRWIAASRPDVILLLAGINDVGSLASTETGAARFRNLLQDIRTADPHILTLVSPLTPVTDTALAAGVAALNVRLPSEVDQARMGGQRVVWCPIVGGALVAATDLVDGVHPNAAGYAKLAAGWLGVLNRWLPALEAAL